jgi:hypothetical protein
MLFILSFAFADYVEPAFITDLDSPFPTQQHIDSVRGGRLAGHGRTNRLDSKKQTD